MIHFGGPTPKPHYAYSNSRHVGRLNQGKLEGWSQKKKSLENQGLGKKLVTKYIDGKGKERWKGTRELQSSEWGS